MREHLSRVKSPLAAALLALAFLAVPLFVSAFVIVEQTDSSAETGTFNLSEVSQTLGTGLSGSVATVSFAASATGFSGFFPALHVTILCFNSASSSEDSMSADCGTSGASSPTPLLTPTKTFYTVNISPTYTLDPTKYYRLDFDNDSSGTGGVNSTSYYGSATDNYPNGFCDSDGALGTQCSPGIADLYFVLDDGQSSTVTRIETVTPASGATIASSTAATFGATGYVNSADYSPDLYLEIQYTPTTAQVLAVGAAPDAGSTILDIPIPSAGEFSLSTTSITGYKDGIILGNYVVHTSILSPSWTNSILNFFGFGAFGTANVETATTTEFTVVQPSAFDVVTASTTASISAYLASSTISIASCTSFASFSLIDCLNLLLVPNTAAVESTLGAFRDTFLSYAPWGYVTRFVVIMTNNSTTSLPMISVPVFLGSASSTDTFTLDPNDMLAGGMADLNSVNAYGTDLNEQEILEPLVDFLIALSALFIIIRDLTGIGHRSGR